MNTGTFSFVVVLCFVILQLAQCYSVCSSNSFRIRQVVLHGGLNPWEFHQIAGVTFKTAVARFDHANAQDTRTWNDENGNASPLELLFSQRLFNQVLKLNPDASESLLLAARAQHIQRWKIPRDSYPMTKPGYLAWRANLKLFHAQTAGQILTEVGYDVTTIDQVKALITKSNFPKDPDSRTLEDALCLVFLEYQLDEFAAKTDDEKTINALRKSWGKMSETGRAAALKLDLSPRAGKLVTQALSG